MTGEGQQVETSLLINALTIHEPRAFVSSRRGGRGRTRCLLRGPRHRAGPATRPTPTFGERGGGASRSGQVYYRCFVTSDGAIAVGALSASLRAKVRAVCRIEHNRDEPGYDPTNPAQQAIDRHLIVLESKTTIP